MSSIIQTVKPKKRLGQHFIKEESTAQDIVNAFLATHPKNVLEVGAGTGMLSDLLMQQQSLDHLVLLDVDKHAIAYLQEKYAGTSVKVVNADFLTCHPTTYFGRQTFDLIGNFPYHISSQIFFKIIAHKNSITHVIGMVQKEVAERLAAKKGNKTYGILSVLLQAYYEVTYLFTVPPEVFHPPPKVDSGVVRLIRNPTTRLDCSETLFTQVVKRGFQQRRKTLRNALKGLTLPQVAQDSQYMNKRAEQLSVADFVQLTKWIENSD